MDNTAESKWFVAYVKSCQEKKVAEKLSAQGVVTYVPVQKVKRRWSDRIKTIDRLLIPGLVFVYCSEQTRLKTFGIAYGINYYLLDRSTELHKPVVVPSRQMEDFERVVRAYNGEEDLEVVRTDIKSGDTVRVIRGPLQGLVCECVEVKSQKKLIIRIGPLGSLLAGISASDVVKE